MVFKQLIINSIEFLSEKYTTGKKIAKVDELFAEKIAGAKQA